MTNGKSLLQGCQLGAVCIAAISLVAGVPVRAQGEKRTVFAPDDFHWRGTLKAGQNLEVINTKVQSGLRLSSSPANGLEFVLTPCGTCRLHRREARTVCWQFLRSAADVLPVSGDHPVTRKHSPAKKRVSGFAPTRPFAPVARHSKPNPLPARSSIVESSVQGKKPQDEQPFCEAERL